MMDYVSNKNGTYDMLLTATRNNKKKSGKEKEKHA